MMKCCQQQEKTTVYLAKIVLTQSKGDLTVKKTNDKTIADAITRQPFFVSNIESKLPFISNTLEKMKSLI